MNSVQLYKNNKSYNVINSGVVVVDGDSKIIVSTDFKEKSEDYSFDIEFIFKNDLVDKESKANKRIIKPNDRKDYLQIELINFNNPLGTSVSEYHFASDEKNRDFSFNLCVYSINNVKTIMYTIYCG